MIARTALDVITFLRGLPADGALRVYAMVLAPNILQVRWCWRTAWAVMDLPPAGSQAAILGVN